MARLWGRPIIRVGMGLGLIVLFLAFYHNSYPDWSVPVSLNSESVRGNEADRTPESNENSPARSRKPRQVNDSGRQLVLLDNATIAIVKLLVEDEARRASLISRKDAGDNVSFIIRIERNPDLEKLISDLCKKFAADAKVSAVALRVAVNDRVEEFIIPEGKVQKMFVEVPLDVTQMPYYLMTTGSPNGPPEEVEPDGLRGAGSVKVEDGWRFDKILDLGKPD